MVNRSRLSTRQSARNAFSLPLLLSHVLLDLSPYLGGFGAILASEISDPSGFRRCLSDVQAFAEHRLDNDIPFRAALYQVSALVSKYPSWGSLPLKERQLAAKRKFLDAEARCRRVNKKLKHFSTHWHRVPKVMRTVLNRAIDLCHRTLGSCDIGWENCGFGPGVTQSSGRSLHEKLVHLSATPGAWGVFQGVLKDFPNWESLLREAGTLSFFKGDRIAYVPKSSETERTIGIQTSLQVFLQKAIEYEMVGRLRSLGVYLEDQERNRSMLDLWSDIATIDLSSASDSVSLELCRLFLPADWYGALFTLSSRFYSFDKKGTAECDRTYHMYAKMSAMGNCSTFPLESLIFMCVAKACTEYCGGDDSLVRVYGDDIIVPQNAALLTLEVLKWIGFEPNRSKTYVTGPFRETCGRDTLHGVDVRPVYLRAEPTDDTALYGLHNRLAANQFGFAFDATLNWIRTLVPRPFWGPAYFLSGDRGIQKIQSYSEWYAGKSSLVDGFFWTPHPHHEGVTVFHGNSCTTWWWLEHLCNIRRFKDAEDEHVGYLAFLLGVRGGLEEKSRWIGRTHSLHCGVWEWPFTSSPPDPKTRPVSVRTMRKIIGGVIWSQG